MESIKIVYSAFTKFAIAIAVSQGATLTEAKKIVLTSFQNHPQKKTTD